MTNLQMKKALEKLYSGKLLGQHIDAHLDSHLNTAHVQLQSNVIKKER